jgi:thiol-disulfide isomerase/thioredoxin
MKNLFLLLFVLFAVNVFGQDSLIVDGSVPKILNGRKIHLNVFYPYNGVYKQPSTNTTTIKDGKFYFSTKASGLEQYTISIDANGSHSSSSVFAFMPTRTKIEFLDAKLGMVNIHGNPINDEYTLYRIESQSANSLSEIAVYMKNWLAENISSPLCPSILYGLIEYKQVSDEEIKHFFDLMPDKNKFDSFGEEISYRIKNTFVDTYAKDFTTKDTSGNNVMLSDFKGKYVLLDFWASWCGPCRRENPNVLKAYNKYHKKGIEFIGISNDDNRKKWTEAIVKDQLPWLQVSDLKRQSKVLIDNRVFGIPTNLLIDPSGKIIAKNLRGEQLQKALSEIDLDD